MSASKVFWNFAGPTKKEGQGRRGWKRAKQVKYITQIVIWK